MTSLTPTERHIIETLSSYIQQGRDVSLAELAVSCHASKSTVVRAVKKLGYRGYRDFAHTFRVGAETSRHALLPTRPVADTSLESAAHRLAKAIAACEGCKNMVFSGGTQSAAFLASYFSRKLALFDILAPASYDYAMAQSRTLPPGIAFFFLQQRPDGRSEAGAASTMQLAIEHGFSLVLITDLPATQRAMPAAVTVRISPNDGSTDLFMPKALMVFEAALERFALLKAASDAS